MEWCEVSNKGHSGNSMSAMRCGAYGHIMFALIAIAIASHPACAYSADSTADSGHSMFSINGFGTLGVVHSSEDKADFTNSIFQLNGAGYTRSWSPGVDSLIGGQISARVTPALSAVLQIIAEQNYDGTFRPHVEWANIKYQFTPDLSARVGRTVIPAFLYSDSLKVGYSIPWVRPPLEVYSLLPITSNDGVDLSYRHAFGQLIDTLQGIGGKNDSPLPGGEGTSRARDSWGFSNTTEYGALTVRMTYQKTHLTVASVDPLFAAFREFGPQGIAIADQYNSDAKPYASSIVAASYDPGNWFAMSEWGHTNTHSFLGDKTGWYASGGYRAGPFTPYLTYAKIRANATTNQALTVANLPPFLAGPATGLNAALNEQLQKIPNQSTVSVGTRWDFAKNFDLKVQFDRTRIGADSDGTLVNIQPGFQPNSRLNVFSVAINFIW
jgi:hypothetical protein